MRPRERPLQSRKNPENPGISWTLPPTAAGAAAVGSDGFDAYAAFDPVSENPRGFRTLERLSLGRIDSGSFLGTSESSLHEFSRSGHRKIARIDSYNVTLKRS